MSINIEIYYEGTAEQWEKFGNIDLAVPLVNIYYGWSDATKKYIDEKTGYIENEIIPNIRGELAFLTNQVNGLREDFGLVEAETDSIIALQNTYIGGESV